ncbi:MAG: hypothetical protein LBH37_00080 [Oscillospiraceae bacterium]|jgi:hypothetical protein|nr:hypothetical protein [Oscillospiraceae bacterium]
MSNIEVKVALNDNTFSKLINKTQDKTLTLGQDYQVNKNTLTLFGNYLETLPPSVYSLGIYLHDAGVEEPFVKIIKTTLTLNTRENKKE